MAQTVSREAWGALTGLNGPEILGFRACGLGFRIQGLGFMAKSLGL